MKASSCTEYPGICCYYLQRQLSAQQVYLDNIRQSCFYSDPPLCLFNWKPNKWKHVKIQPRYILKEVELGFLTKPHTVYDFISDCVTGLGLLRSTIPWKTRLCRTLTECAPTHDDRVTKLLKLKTNTRYNCGKYTLLIFKILKRKKDFCIQFYEVLRVNFHFLGEFSSFFFSLSLIHLRPIRYVTWRFDVLRLAFHSYLPRSSLCYPLFFHDHAGCPHTSQIKIKITFIMPLFLIV